MANNKEKSDSAQMATGGNQALAQRSSALVSRGLRALSCRDSSRPTKASEEDIFRELGKALTSSLQLDQVLRTIMDKIDELLRPDAWSLLLLDDSKEELHVELSVGQGSEELREAVRANGPLPDFGKEKWVAARSFRATSARSGLRQKCFILRVKRRIREVKMDFPRNPSAKFPHRRGLGPFVFIGVTRP